MDLAKKFGEFGPVGKLVVLLIGGAIARRVLTPSVVITKCQCSNKLAALEESVDRLTTAVHQRKQTPPRNR